MTHFVSVDDAAVLTSVADLDRAECLSLLAGAGFGRVVGTDCALPAVHPITYLLDGQEVIFRTAPGSMLAAAAGDVVAFQADDYDPATGLGWTVLGIGKSYVVADRRTAPGAEPPAHSIGGPADGPRRDSTTLAIPLWRLSGHRLSRSAPTGDRPSDPPTVADHAPRPDRSHRGVPELRVPIIDHGADPAQHLGHR